MKILGEKSTSYPIKGSPGSKIQQFRHKKFGYTTSIFMAVTDLLSSSRDYMSIAEDLPSPLIVYMNRYRGVRAFNEQNCVT